MKNFVGLFLILVASFSLNAGNYASYLAIVGHSGALNQPTKNAAVMQLLSFEGDANNTVIIDLLAHRVLNLPYRDIITLRLEDKLERLTRELDQELDIVRIPSSAPSPTLPIHDIISHTTPTNPGETSLNNLVELERAVLVLSIGSGASIGYHELLEMPFAQKIALLGALKESNPPIAGAGAGAGIGTGKSLSSAELAELETKYFDSFPKPMPFAMNWIEIYQQVLQDFYTPRAELYAHILRLLFSPKQVTKQELANRALITPDQGIAQEVILDYLLAYLLGDEHYKKFQNKQRLQGEPLTLNNKQYYVIFHLLPNKLRHIPIMSKD